MFLVIRYDSWDTFDIVDFNAEEKLHKCLFHSDRSQQWLNLKKKPIRSLSAVDVEKILLDGTQA